MEKGLENFKYWLKAMAYRGENLIMGRNSKAARRKTRKDLIKKKNKAREGNKHVMLVESIAKTNAAIVDSPKGISNTTRSMNGHELSRAYNWQKSCNHYPTLVCQLGDLQLYAATKGILNGSTLKKIDLVVNCSQASITTQYSVDNVNSMVRGGAQFESLKQHVVIDKQTPELHLDWQDGDDWPGGIAFWKELYAICQKEGYKAIVFCCLGGHGRTGTALAAFLIANSEVLKCADVLISEKIRDGYCEQAIETLVQERYLDYIATARSLSEGTDGQSIVWATKEVKKVETTRTAEVSAQSFLCKGCGKWNCECPTIPPIEPRKSAFSDLRCPACDHYADLCDCSVEDMQQAVSKGKQFELIPVDEITSDNDGDKQYDPNKPLSADNPLCDGHFFDDGLTDVEAQSEANKAIVAEVTRNMLKDYQWK